MKDLFLFNISPFILSHSDRSEVSDD